MVSRRTSTGKGECALTDEIAFLLPFPEKMCLTFSERTGDSGSWEEKKKAHLHVTMIV